MGLSKSKESYDISTLQTKIQDENSYGKVREEATTEQGQGSKEKDIDIINKGETKPEKVIPRSSIPPNDLESEKIMEELIEKVRRGGSLSDESARRTSVDPVAPIQQVIDDFEKKEVTVERRGSFLGQIYAENAEKKEEAKEEEKDLLDKPPESETVSHTSENIHQKEECEIESTKEELAEELTDRQAKMSEFVHTMLQETKAFRPSSDPLELDEGKQTPRKKSEVDPLDVEIHETIITSNSGSSTYYEYSSVSSFATKSTSEIKEEEQLKALNVIREIRRDAEKLRKTVEEFEGRKDDVQYVYLNETLLRCLIKLDSVNASDDFVKEQRKRVADYVQDCVRLLDSRAEGDEPDIEVSF